MSDVLRAYQLPLSPVTGGEGRGEGVPSFPHSLIHARSMSANPFTSDFLRDARGDARRPHGALSYVRGKTSDALKFMTIPALLDRAVLRFGGRDAVIFAPTGERLSWHDLHKRSDDVA